MQRFAVALTLASIAVALNLNDEDDVLVDPLDAVDAPETTLISEDGGDMEGGDMEGEDEVEEEASIFDLGDADDNGIPDIFERVLEQYVVEPFVEDCSCLTSSGLPVFTNELGDGFIEVTFQEEGEDPRTYNYPANYGTAQCSAWDEFLPDFCADAFGVPLDDAPDYCTQSWCWVSAETCLTGVFESDYFPDSGLSYSYLACPAPEEEEEEQEPEPEEEEVADEEGDEGDDEEVEE